MLRSWVEALTSLARITARLDAIEALKGDLLTSQELTAALENVADLERLLGKISYGSLTGRDCLALLRSLRSVEPVKALLQKFTLAPIAALRHTLSPLHTLCELIAAAISPDAPLALAAGGVIAEGYSQELDGYRNASTSGKQWLLDLEAAERQETGIKNLKIQYNRVFGYLIEITKSYLDQVPLRYTRRQTLANCERFVTAELQEIERKIVNAQQLALALEAQIFAQVKDAIAGEIGMIQQNALALKTLDALLSLAKVARDNRYVKPIMTRDGAIHIVEGRHPIVEKTLTDTPFVPNDALLDGDDNRMLIITGPNMAGKSTYMRQVALITLMAHMGGFVPARKPASAYATGLYPNWRFRRSGQRPKHLYGGDERNRRHFARATAHSSSCWTDCRGTSTFDGLAIAWAVVEYLLDKKKIGAKTLFATHYHELSELEGRFEGVKNYCISVKEHGEDVIFLRKILPGGADRSYGVHVARLAGIPPQVVTRAHEIQARLEVSDINQEAISHHILEKKKKKDRQTDLFHLDQDELLEELKNLDVYALTPMDAMNTLFRLREKARKL